MKDGYRLSVLGVAEKMRDSASLPLSSSFGLRLREDRVAPGVGSYMLGSVAALARGVLPLSWCTVRPFGPL
jgi:hypothetical protein